MKSLFFALAGSMATFFAEANSMEIMDSILEENRDTISKDFGTVWIPQNEEILSFNK